MTFLSNHPRAASFVAGATCALLLGGTTAIAANGGVVTLGEANTATKTTTIKNSNGTPLALKGQGAPLKVSSKTLVKKFNADAVDGKSAKDFASAKAVTFSYDGGLFPFDVDDDNITDAYGAVIFCPPGSQMTGGGGGDYSTATGYLLESSPDVEGGEGWAFIIGIEEGATENVSGAFVTVTCWNPFGTKGAGSYRLVRPGAATQARIAKAVAARR